MLCEDELRNLWQVFADFFYSINKGKGLFKLDDDGAGGPTPAPPVPVPATPAPA